MDFMACADELSKWMTANRILTLWACAVGVAVFGKRVYDEHIYKSSVEPFRDIDNQVKAILSKNNGPS